ncbi:MAG: hypothetical protein LBT62_05915 [Deltaproteobacteria bacterium]|jgi:hypothetical protein|nr:hypothetical protein [Deltaproteobacteria bacterium]
MNVNSTGNAASFTGQLVTTLLDNQKAQTDLAIKTIEVAARQQMAIQQQQTALMALALMTGIGTKLNVYL